MQIPTNFITAVQNVFPNNSLLNKLLLKGDINAVEAFLQLACRDYELTPDFVLRHLDSVTLGILRVTALRAREIKALLDEAAPLVREELRRRRHEEERED